MAAVERNAGLARIKTAMIEKKMTQAELADAADCHEKTIQNLMNGRSVRDQTLFDVCMVLGLDFEEIKASWSAAPASTREDPGHPASQAGVAPVYMGAYTRAAVDHYIGSYLTVRPSFTVPDGVVAYRTEVIWDEDWPSLVFEEKERPDAPFAHRGRLYVPAATMFIHLVSLTKGSMRMIVVSTLDTTGHMRGIITTLNKQRAMLLPVSAPIVYQRRQDFGGTAFGEIAPGHASYAGYKELLTEAVGQGYAKLIGG